MRTPTLSLPRFRALSGRSTSLKENSSLTKYFSELVTNTSRSFSSTPSSSASTVAQRKRHRDPYAIAQARARKAANISRQEVLRKGRAAVLGDPVRGVPTPFVESFDTGAQPDARQTSSVGASTPLNFSISDELLSESIQRSRWLATPTAQVDSSGKAAVDPNPVQDEIGEEARNNAEEALRRIANLSIGNNRSRLLINKQRCIERFGRHNTDTSLGTRAKEQHENETSPSKIPRVGPDTGSSEVQIAILTAKIRAVADGLDFRGRMDKMNKRNLRLLVHRRQKLLKYLHRKEKGGPRWKNLIETLGLTEGTWRGEISL